MMYVHCLLRFGHSDLAKQILNQMKERVERSLLIGEKEKQSFEEFRMTVENEKSKLSNVQSVWIVCCGYNAVAPEDWCCSLHSLPALHSNFCSLA